MITLPLYRWWFLFGDTEDKLINYFSNTFFLSVLSFTFILFKVSGKNKHASDSNKAMAEAMGASDTSVLALGHLALVA